MIGYLILALALMVWVAIGYYVYRFWTAVYRKWIKDKVTGR